MGEGLVTHSKALDTKRQDPVLAPGRSCIQMREVVRDRFFCWKSTPSGMTNPNTMLYLPMRRLHTPDLSAGLFRRHWTTCSALMLQEPSAPTPADAPRSPGSITPEAELGQESSFLAPALLQGGEGCGRQESTSHHVAPAPS